MRNKRLLRTLSALCLTLVLASGFTVPAFAQGAAPPPAEDTTNDSNVVVEETEKAPPLTVLQEVLISIQMMRFMNQQMIIVHI